VELIQSQKLRICMGTQVCHILQLLNSWLDIDEILYGTLLWSLVTEY